MAEAPPQGGDAPAGAAQGTTWVEPYRGYNFKLDIHGVTTGAHFINVSGVGVKVETIPYREGGAGSVTHYLPGPTRYGEITLTQGMTQSKEVWDWITHAMNGEPDRRHVSILLLDNDGRTEVVRWNLENAWASEWRLHPLDAGGREVAIATLTLVFDSLTWGGAAAQT